VSPRATSGFLGVLEGPATLDPGRVALVAGGSRTTYGELAAAVGRAAQALGAAGVGRGARVAVVADAGVASVAALLGTARLGGAAALMNPRLTSGELAGLAAEAGVGWWVAGPSSEEVVGELAGPALVDLGRPGPAPPAARPRPGDAALVLFTSGTTGRPKAVVLTHRLLDARIAAFAPAFDPASAPSVSLMCVPLAHIGGALGLLVSLARGHTTVVQARFEAGQWLELVARHRVEACFLVPTMLHRILEHPGFGQADLSSLRSLAYGAAPAPPELVRRATQALPHVAFTNVFGQTETLGSICTLGPEDHRQPDRLASVGRPLPGVEAKVVDPDTGRELGPGETGELWVRTEAAVAPPGAGEPGGWLRTGDLVSRDADGYLYPAGRLADTINRGGEKFSPSEVEQVVLGHPAVAEAAAAGVPDPEMGSRVGLAVVARRPVTAGELREFCRGKLASFKLPEVVALVESLPYSETGKVSRAELARLIQEKASA
jgi:acyl-CoA synthetase (AMP-forming)/AMP-acid ligase II